MRHTPCGCAPYAELLPFAKPASKNKVLIVTVYYEKFRSSRRRGGYQPPSAGTTECVSVDLFVLFVAHADGTPSRRALRTVERTLP